MATSKPPSFVKSSYDNKDLIVVAGVLILFVVVIVLLIVASEDNDSDGKITRWDNPEQYAESLRKVLRAYANFKVAIHPVLATGTPILRGGDNPYDPKDEKDLYDSWNAVFRSPAFRQEVADRIKDLIDPASKDTWNPPRAAMEVSEQYVTLTEVVSLMLSRANIIAKIEGVDSDAEKKRLEKLKAMIEAKAKYYTWLLDKSVSDQSDDPNVGKDIPIEKVQNYFNQIIEVSNIFSKVLKEHKKEYQLSTSYDKFSIDTC